jgi:hypothetical protein
MLKQSQEGVNLLLSPTLLYMLPQSELKAIARAPCLVKEAPKVYTNKKKMVDPKKKSENFDG